MSRPGIGAMIHRLSGGSEESPSKYAGRKITAAVLADNALSLTFSDGVRIRLYDDAQSCCESRYITTDDDPVSLVGGMLRAIEAKLGPETEGEYEDMHETCFVEVSTVEGVIVTLTTHVEHNGYYGGFGLTIKEETS